MKSGLYKRLVHRQTWGLVSPRAGPAFFLVLVYSLHLIWAGFHVYVLEDAVINTAVFYRTIPLYMLVMLGGIALLVTGYHLHHRGQGPLWYQHLAANYYAIGLVWAGHLTGSLNLATGVVLMGAPLVGFLLLHRKVILIASINAAVLLFIINCASAYSMLPYAPLLTPPGDQQTPVAWTTAQFLMAAPHLAFNVVVAALVLGKWRLKEQQAQRLSLTDTLTGVANRRGILYKLQRELSRAKRHGHPLTVAIFDLDHFKQINDRWGHPMGDQILRACTEAVSEEIRASDTLGRFGGEEFLLVLTDTTEEQAGHLLKRCQRRIQALSLHSTAGDPVLVTASFGCCSLAIEQHHEITRDDLINTADQALYAAKNSGRNRIEKAKANHKRTLANATIRSGWHWQELLRPSSWRPFLYSILGWSPVAKAMLISCITAYIAMNAVGVLLLLLTLENIQPFINVQTIQTSTVIAGLVMLTSLIIFFSGFSVRRRWPGSLFYQHLSLQFFGLALVSLGYLTGILYISTGIMLLCSPIIGFMLFERRIVIQVFLVSLGSVVVLAYLSAFGVLPYAPAFKPFITSQQINIPLLTFLIYYFITICIALVFVLFNHILGSWRERSAEIKAAGKIDALTGVMNRHCILQELEAAISRSQRLRQGSAVILLDMDHFKQINDTWGHPAGDQVLKHAAKRLRQTLREEDSIGRFGGEEFLLVLQELTQAQAKKLVERCRQCLADAVTVEGSRQQTITVSASFGLVFFNGESAVNADDLIRLADVALYRAKNAGRNRVEVSDVPRSMRA